MRAKSAPERRRPPPPRRRVVGDRDASAVAPEAHRHPQGAPVVLEAGGGAVDGDAVHLEAHRVEGDLGRRRVDAPHLERRWQHYLGGDAKPVLKPLAATPREQIEKARERLLDASKALRMIEDLPWFDKERPNYPDRLTRARDAVAQARAEVAKIERGGAQAVAS